MKANINRLTNKQLKAISDEVNRQTASNVRNLSPNISAMVLWALHVHPKTRYGKKRLLDFQRSFLPLIQELQEYYLSENADDTVFACKYRLKHEVGIDVDQLDDMFTLKVKIEK